MFYIGYTTNLERRFQEHCNGKSTAPRRPLKLIFWEFYLSEDDARRREMYFKTSPGRQALKIILKESMDQAEFRIEKLKIRYIKALGNARILYYQNT